MDEPNGRVLLEAVLVALLIGDGLLGLGKGGLFFGGRLVFKLDQRRLWRLSLAWTFGLAGLLVLHLARVAVTRVSS